MDQILGGQRAWLDPSEFARLQSQMSLPIELSADALAGRWAAHARAKGEVTQNQVQVCLDLLFKNGDVDHGSGEQRREWFQRGFSSRSVKELSTFSYPNLLQGIPEPLRTTFKLYFTEWYNPSALSSVRRGSGGSARTP